MFSFRLHFSKKNICARILEIASHTPLSKKTLFSSHPYLDGQFCLCAFFFEEEEKEEKKNTKCKHVYHFKAFLLCFAFDFVFNISFGISTQLFRNDSKKNANLNKLYE